MDEIEDRGASGEDGSSGEDCAFADDGAFVDSGVAADEDVVFNDDGAGVDGLKDAADLGCGAEVNALADLGAGADEGVGIDHGAFIDVGADVDVHGRHADDTAGDECARADGGATGDDAQPIGNGEVADGVGVFVDEGQGAGWLGFSLFGDLSDAEAEEDAALDPGVDAPAGGSSGVRRCGAESASFDGGTESEKSA